MNGYGGSMKYRIAIGTDDLVNVTEHFGQCSCFLIIEIDQKEEGYVVIEKRETAHTFSCGEHQNKVILEKIKSLHDCQIVLVKQMGGQTEKLLIHNNLIPLQYQGTIVEALRKIQNYYLKQIFYRKDVTYEHKFSE